MPSGPRVFLALALTALLSSTPRASAQGVEYPALVWVTAATLVAGGLGLVSTTLGILTVRRSDDFGSKSGDQGLSLRPAFFRDPDHELKLGLSLSQAF